MARYLAITSLYYYFGAWASLSIVDFTDCCIPFFFRKDTVKTKSQSPFQGLDGILNPQTVCVSHLHFYRSNILAVERAVVWGTYTTITSIILLIGNKDICINKLKMEGFCWAISWLSLTVPKNQAAIWVFFCKGIMMSFRTNIIISVHTTHKYSEQFMKWF